MGQMCRMMDEMANSRTQFELEEVPEGGEERGVGKRDAQRGSVLFV